MFKKLLFAVIGASLAGSLSAQVIFSEDFEGSSNLPAGWSQTTNATDGGWRVDDAAGLSSQYFPVPPATGNVLGTNDDACDCDKSVDIISMPAQDLSAVSGPLTLLFDAFYGGFTFNGATEVLTVLASEDGGATWADVEQVFGDGSGWLSRAVDVSAYAGKPSVTFAFHYNDNGEWLYGAILDNVQLIVPDNVIKAALGPVRLNRFFENVPNYMLYDPTGYQKQFVGKELIVQGSVINTGFPTITSFDLTWSNGADTYVQSYAGLSVGLGQTFDFNLDENPVVIANGINNITVTLSNVNGVGDDDATDNVGSTSATGVIPVSDRKVVIEEATGTWCGWCPRGAVMLDYVTEQNPDHAIGIAVHNGDPMVVTEYDDAIGSVIGGYPSGLADRYYNNIDPFHFEKYFIERMATQVPVRVLQDVDFDAATRTATVTTHLQFKQAMNGDYRVSVVYVEDDVTGTTSAYNQVNYYSGGGVGPMAGYENLPGTIPAAQMVYNHVARAIVGGFNGLIGSVPAANAQGDVVNYISEFVVPNNFDVDEMHAISLLIDGSTGEIINAESTPIPFASTGVKDLSNGMITVKMIPNPVEDVARIKLSLKETSDIMVRVINGTGQVVVEQNYANVSGQQNIPFQAGSLPAGMYTLTVSAKGQVASEPFVIVR